VWPEGNGTEGGRGTRVMVTPNLVNDRGEPERKSMQAYQSRLNDPVVSPSEKER